MQQRGGEQGVAHHGERERPDRGVHRRAVDRGAPEVQREDHADEGDVEQRVRQGQRGVRDARPLGLGGLGEGEAPRQGEQRAADQPGVEAEAHPAGLGHGPFGEHQQADDGGRREAEEEQIGVAGARHVLAQHDLVPAPDQVAQGRHGRGETEQHPGGPVPGAAAAGVDHAGHGGGRGGGAQPEVPHDQGESLRPPAERGADGVGAADQDEDQLGRGAGAAAGARRGQQGPRGGRGTQRTVEGGARRRAHRSLPVRAASALQGPRWAWDRVSRLVCRGGW